MSPESTKPTKVEAEKENVGFFALTLAELDLQTAVLAANQETDHAKARFIISDDLEFRQYDLVFLARQQGIAKEERAIQAKNSREAYLDLLSNKNLNLEIRTFASGPSFREIVCKYAEGTPGPFFQRLIQALYSVDEKGLEWIRENWEAIKHVFPMMDETYFKLVGRVGIKKVRYNGVINSAESAGEAAFTIVRQIFDFQDGVRKVKDYDKAVAQILRNYKKCSGDFFDKVFNFKDQSDFACFVRSNFGVFPLYAVLTSVAREKNIEDPLPNYMQIKRLIKAVPENKREFLNPYMVQRAFSTLTKEIVDKEILDGRFEKSETLAEFLVLMNYYEGWDESGDWVMDLLSEAGQYWTEQYIKSKISKEDFLSIPPGIEKILESYQGLPENIRKRLFGYKDGRPLWLAGLLKKPFYKFAPVISELISGGIYPVQSSDFEKLERIKGPLEKIVLFGQSLFGFSEKSGSCQISQIWMKRCLDGEVSDNILEKVAGNILEIRKIAEDNFDPKIINVLRSELHWVYISLAMTEDIAPIKTLLSAGIFPTQHLLDFVGRENDLGMQELKRLQDETLKGRFDPLNPLQKDLEFMQYAQMLAEKSPNKDALYKDFQAIEFLEYSDNVLIPKERMEAEAAAFEAANFYWFVKSRIDLGRKVAVIGNQRYGSYFVTEPLKRELEELGVQVSSYHVPSSREVDKRLFKSIEDYLKSERFEDIIIVDGTQTSYESGMQRFPRSMLAYFDRFRNGYDMSYWAPHATEHILLGDKKMQYSPPLSEGAQIIFANPVIDPSFFEGHLPFELKNHEPGFFDDPDQKTGKQEFIFNNKGIQIITNGKTEEELVRSIQAYMENVMDRMIRETNPQFSDSDLK